MRLGEKKNFSRKTLKFPSLLDGQGTEKIGFGHRNLCILTKTLNKRQNLTDFFSSSFNPGLPDGIFSFQKSRIACIL
jgi:hypothetical protein